MTSGTASWKVASFDSRLSDRNEPFGSENSEMSVQNSASVSRLGSEIDCARAASRAAPRATSVSTRNARATERLTTIREPHDKPCERAVQAQGPGVRDAVRGPP